MNKQLLALLLLGLIAFGAAGWYVFFNNSGSVSQDQTQTSQSEQLPVNTNLGQENTLRELPVEEPVAGEKQITLSEVSQHGSKNDCWTVINDTVYDLTKYIPQHEGKDNIVSACGIDSTAYFSGEQAGKLGGAKDHTSINKALNDLNRLKIGVLAN